MKQVGLPAETLPIMGLSVSEAELQWLNPDDVAGHYACWDYFMSHPAPQNQAFLERWHRYIGDERPVYAPMVASVLGFRLWCKAVTAAGTTATAAVRQYMLGQTEVAFNGSSVVMGVNHHLEMAVSVGRATRDRQFEVVWRVPRPIAGDPWAAAGIIADTAAANAQRDLLDALPTPLIVLDERGAVLFRSASTQDQFGAEMSPHQLTTLSELVHRLDGSAAESPEGPLPEITLHDAKGRTRHMAIATRRMVFSGEPAHLLSLVDVTYIREIEARLITLNVELQRLATTDPLTGVHNRRYFLTEMTAQLQQMLRYPRPAVLFILDLDNFKSLNDRYGHEAGDQALIQTAAIARRLLRGNDVFARIGGEEFAGLLPESDLALGTRAVERLRENIGRLQLQVGEHFTGLTCSIGMTALDPQHDTPETAMKRADNALYLAKREGRNCVRQG